MGVLGRESRAVHVLEQQEPAGGVDGRAGRQACSSRPCGGREGAAARNRLEARPTWPRRRPEHAGFAEGWWARGWNSREATTWPTHHINFSKKTNIRMKY